MSQSTANPELKAAQAKKLAGQTLTPGEEVLIAVDESNRAASEAVDRGLAQSNKVASLWNIRRSTIEL